MGNLLSLNKSRLISFVQKEFYTIEEDRYKLDLWKVNEYILKECGVKEDNIVNLNLCTSCNSDKFHSYRKHNQTSERLGMILEIE